MTDTQFNTLRDSITSLVKSSVGVNAGYYLTQIRRLADDASRSSSFFSALLEIFVHLEFSEEDAIVHWENVLEKTRQLSETLGRNVGLHMAIVDYFTHANPMLTAPMLIEIHVFKQTERLAMIDGLTGVFNRRYMDIALRKELNRCERYSKNLSIFIVDIDNFKMVNDTKGHIFGDQILKEVARFIKNMVREEDIVCRYGGEEFLVLLPETDTAGAFILAERIRLSLKAHGIFKTEGITFSGGIATYPGAAKDASSLIKSADRALYQAKYTGKDRIIIADTDRRRFGRHVRSCSLDIAVPGFTSNTPLCIVTRNVSLGGVQFECAERFDIDTELTLIFNDLISGGEEIQTLGRITWARRGQDGFVYGVSFVDIPETLARKINSSYLTAWDHDSYTTCNPTFDFDFNSDADNKD